LPHIAFFTDARAGSYPNVFSSFSAPPGPDTFSHPVVVFCCAIGWFFLLDFMILPASRFFFGSICNEGNTFSSPGGNVKADLVDALLVLRGDAQRPFFLLFFLSAAAV